MDIIEQLLKEISSNEGQISQTETQKYLFQEMRRLSALVDDEISDNYCQNVTIGTQSEIGCDSRRLPNAC